MPTMLGFAKSTHRQLKSTVHYNALEILSLLGFTKSFPQPTRSIPNNTVNMKQLKQAAKLALQKQTRLPFSIYSSVKEQRIANVPIMKPMLICIFDGCKKLGMGKEMTCPTGSFVFLSNSPKVDIRNISEGHEYFALVIEFEYSDFDCFVRHEAQSQMYFQGTMDSVFQNTLMQFIEWSCFAPSELWTVRRQEILQMIYHLGYQEVTSMMEPPSVSLKVHNIIRLHISDNLSVTSLAERLAMSESTLRRKLHSEGNSVQLIKDRAKLGYGLHLIQSTFEPIARIAEQCGYQSQSRFTDKFKQLFGITPTDIRKTRMHVLGE